MNAGPTGARSSVRTPTGLTLPRSRERKLVSAAATGDVAAREELVEAFLPLISGMARNYRRSTVERSELVQEGVVGLLRALRRYDPSYGCPFWPYAAWWVRQAMQRLVAELGRPIVLSDRALRELARIKTARREHLQDHRKDPSASELAERTGLARAHVEKLLAVEHDARGLEEPGIRDGRARAKPIDQLADPRSEDEYERVRRRAVDHLDPIAQTLTERERDVLRARYGLRGPEQTLRQIGGELGLSAERVRQIQEIALKKLRTAMA